MPVSELDERLENFRYALGRTGRLDGRWPCVPGLGAAIALVDAFKDANRFVGRVTDDQRPDVDGPLDLTLVSANLRAMPAQRFFLPRERFQAVGKTYVARVAVTCDETQSDLLAAAADQ